MLLFFLTLPLSAQKLTGRVVGEDGKPLPMVLVMLFDESHVSAISYNVTMPEGEFALDCPADTAGLFVIVRCDGFKERQLPLPASGYNFGDIRMEVDAHRLGEAQATARRLRRTARGYTVNMRGDIRTKNASVAEMLPFLPQLTAEQDGTLKINGKVVKQIYLDNMPLTGGVQELRVLPGSLLDSVEVETVMDVSQTAVDEGGVLRLHLRRLPKGGYYGGVAANVREVADYGRFDGYGMGQVAYRYKNFNLYEYLAYVPALYLMDEQRAILNPDGTPVETYDSRERGRDHALASRTSMGLNLGSRHFIGLAYLLKGSKKPLTTDGCYVYPGMEDVMSVQHDTTATWQHQLTMRYRGVLGKRGHQLEAMADYLHQLKGLGQMYAMEQADGLATQPFARNDYVDMFYAKLEWNAPMPGSWGNLQVGAKLNYVYRLVRPMQMAGAEGAGWMTDRYSAIDSKSLMPVAYVAWQRPVTRRLDFNVGLNFQLNRLEYVPLVGL